MNAHDLAHAHALDFGRSFRIVSIRADPCFTKKLNDFEQKTERLEFGPFILNHLQN